MSAVTRSGRDRRYKDAELRRDGRRNQVLLVLALSSGLVYVGWLFTVVSWDHPLAAGSFLLAETICIVSVFLWGMMLMRKRQHPSEGQPWPGDPPDVDLLVTVCREPLEVVRATLAGVASIDYPHLRVTVLDDGHSPELQRLTAEYGFAYHSRENPQFAKSGNLNFGLSVTSAPFVATLDADQVPHPDMVSKLVGFMQVAAIGFVVSRQAFQLPKGDPWGNCDSVFYEAMEVGRNDSNSAISCGSGVLYRRSALEEIGGFPEWSLVEDLFASLLMEQKGWRGVYFPYALTLGTAPRDVFTQQRQRWQWAVDSLRIMFWRCPLVATGLDLRQRLNYFHFGWHYVMYGIAYPIFFLLPIWSLFTGEFVLNASAGLFLCYRIPYLACSRLMTGFMTNQHLNLKAFQMQVGLWPVFASAIVTAIANPFTRPRYVVTLKGDMRTRLLHRVAALAPNLAVMVAAVAAIEYGLMHYSDRPVFLAVLAFWCCWTLVALSRYTFVAIFSEYFAD